MSISPLSVTGAAQVPLESGTAARSAGAGSAPSPNLFERMLGNAVQNDDKAAAAVRELALGHTDNLHEVMLQVAQADISFRLILEIRNRLTDAYQEITKMQV